MEESIKSLSLDYLNLLINGQAFSDVTFSVEGHFVHAHRCILAARSLFFRKFFCGAAADPVHPGSPGLFSDHVHRGWLSPSLQPSASSPRVSTVAGGGGNSMLRSLSSVGYEVFLLLLQFLYSGQVSVAPPKLSIQGGLAPRRKEGDGGTVEEGGRYAPRRRRHRGGRRAIRRWPHGGGGTVEEGGRYADGRTEEEGDGGTA